MNKIRYFILISIIISTFSGCDEDEKYNTSHPEEGGIILTMDWSNITAANPSTYQARVTSSSGTSRIFENLSGTENNLVVEPGDAILLIYNHAENITISGTKAIINNIGTGIATNPGLFFSYFGEISTLRDRDMTHTALMRQQTGELKISFAIKPANMINRINRISATLEGVASELEMKTNNLSGSSLITTTFTQNSYYAATMVRLFGFDPSTRQNLILDIEFKNGSQATITSDLTSLLKDFNASKSSLYTLNANMYIANENAATVTLDHWECNTESRYLSASASEVTLPGNASVETLTVITDQPLWEYSVVQTGDWLTVSKINEQLKLSATENTVDAIRQATIHISAGGESESITVIQEGSAPDFYTDKEVVKIQNATTGNGINIVLMGDGYTVKDMNKKNGKYEKDMRTATDHFFSVYPYTKYRDYFNVYMVTAISNEEGISIKSDNTLIDTKFESIWEGPHSTGINCNVYTVAEYVYMIHELSTVDIHDITVIMPINADIYAGTCSMHFPDYSNGYGEGFSISMCPVGSDFDRVVAHEVGGHGFAKVIDEYINYPKETIPENEIEVVNKYKKWGWCENIDFYSNITQTSWNGFANHAKYNMVGTFEGAYLYGKGVWRPEYNSCMNNNILYFNAPTRWAQVRRIMHLAGFDYSFSRFLQDDVIPEYPSEMRRKAENPAPLAPPVITELDKSKIKRNH